MHLADPRSGIREDGATFVTRKEDPQRAVGPAYRAEITQLKRREKAPDPGSALHAETDRELVRRFKCGDRSAFELLYRRYHQRVLGLARRHMRDADEAQDVAQEAFLKAWRGLPRFREESAFFTWLYQIAVNTVINHIVAARRRPPNVDIDVEDAQFREGAHRLRSTEDPMASLSRDETCSAINGALGALPNDFRQALSLRELEGMSYKQIAARLNCPLGTVRSRIFRARRAIRRHIGLIHKGRRASK